MRRSRVPISLAALSAACLALASSAHADANSLIDYLGPRELALGDAMRADAKGATSSVLNPAGLSLTNELVLEGYYGFRPADGANSAYGSICDSTTPVAGCVYYRFFNASLDLGGGEVDRRAHELGFTASRALSQRLLFGLSTKYFDYNTEVANDVDASGITWDVGLTLLLSQTFSLGVAGYNLYSTEQSSQYPTALGVGMTVRPTGQLSLGMDGLWNFDLPDGQRIGRYGGGAEYFLLSGNRQSGFPLRIGAVHDRALEATYMTGGLGYRTERVGIDVGVRQQVAGGSETMALFSLRLFSPSGAIR